MRVYWLDVVLFYETIVFFDNRDIELDRADHTGCSPAFSVDSAKIVLNNLTPQNGLTIEFASTERAGCFPPVGRVQHCTVIKKDVASLTQ